MHINAYLAKMKKGEIMSLAAVENEFSLSQEEVQRRAIIVETKSANALISDLRSMAPLSVLQPDKKMMQVAKTHGKYMKRVGYRFMPFVNPHLGAGNKGEHTRIKEGSDMTKGGENIQATNYNVRETFIGLLIDAGIETLGHRKAIMNPEWNYGVCHLFGPVSHDTGDVSKDNWIQNFGAK